MKEADIRKAYEIAREQFAALGVDTEAAMKTLETVPISLHCWQGDDVGGFERPGAELSGGGIQATGNYPGKARTIGELRADFEKAVSVVPGKHRIALHASYLDNGGKYVERDAIEPRHFQSWIDWAKANQLGIDFNSTFFSHPKAADGFTLSHPDRAIRDFWIAHGALCRKIGEEIGRQLGSTVVTNVWIPDGYKDIPVDRTGPRERLTDSLDKMFAEPIDPKYHLDAVEAKLFGLGAESYTTGSAEYYLGYAISRQKLLTLDSGHFHPTEVISEKIASALNTTGYEVTVRLKEKETLIRGKQKDLSLAASVSDIGHMEIDAAGFEDGACSRETDKFLRELKERGIDGAIVGRTHHGKKEGGILMERLKHEPAASFNPLQIEKRRNMVKQHLLYHARARKIRG